MIPYYDFFWRFLNLRLTDLLIILKAKIRAIGESGKSIVHTNLRFDKSSVKIFGTRVRRQ